MKFIVLLEVPKSLIEEWKPSHEGDPSDEAITKYALGMLLFDTSIDVLAVSKREEISQ